MKKLQCFICVGFEYVAGVEGFGSSENPNKLDDVPNILDDEEIEVRRG
ncbi:MAG: hypothetical protein NWE94_06700 [Candidatus Bathyarchaeota archaeon]|nr:hypothetical protein [Candidatus Bathyarchaeota archaeon]